VLPLKTIQQRRKRGEEAGPADPTDIELLKQIRDLLQIQAGVSSAVTKSELADQEEMAEGQPDASTVTFERPTGADSQDGTPTSHRR
jgi:large conductance mechanosensitive channel